MEDRSLPPPFPEEPPAGEPVQLSHEQLTVAAEFAAHTLDFIYGLLDEEVARGALTEEQAEAERREIAETFGRRLEDQEAGRFVPDPDADRRRRIGILEVAMGNLDLFDRVGRAAVAAGEWTEEEFAERRQELVERANETQEHLDAE